MRAFGHRIQPSDLVEASGELYELYSVKEKKPIATKNADFTGVTGLATEWLMALRIA
jgi:hypothetical protein